MSLTYICEQCKKSCEDKGKFAHKARKRFCLECRKQRKKLHYTLSSKINQELKQKRLASKTDESKPTFLMVWDESNEIEY